MKVLFLTTNWPTEDSPVNGIFVQEHARAAAQHAEVAVLYLERAPAERGAVDVVPLPGELPAWRVRYRRLGRPASYAAFLAGPLTAYRKLRRGGFEPDVVHANSFLSALPALLLGRIARVPVVYTEHWTIFLPENPSRLSAPMLRGARLALRHADAVLPVSDHLGAALRRLAPGARLRVVPNAVDEHVFHPGRREQRDGTTRLLTAGLLDSDAKGVDLLLEALALLREPGLRLDVVGDGAKRVDYEALSRRLRLEQVVTFHGLKSKPQLAQLMREADLFVLASRYENSPCVLLEAMASGLPVAAARVGGVPEVVDDRAGVLVEPGEPARFAAGISAALARLDAFEREGIARRARERYGLQAVGRQLAEVYAEVVARRTR